ncbi:hypothetical protein IJG01_01335 [Candidatus Saccharibacteria bacterium]|nr:hypothetical protein [Candidatus Saccharibacteria bacterium]
MMADNDKNKTLKSGTRQKTLFGGEDDGVVKRDKSISIEVLEEKLEHLKNQEKQTKAVKAEIQRLKTSIAKRYNDNKMLVMQLEEKNFDKLIFLRSTHGFYKLVDHSAVFYVFNIAIKLDIMAELRPDGDYTERSKIGIVSIRDVDKVAKKLKSLKILPVKTKDTTGDILIYQLPWKYTNKQLDKYINDNTYASQKFNHIVMVENVFPTLFLEINELIKAIYENVRKMPGPIERETLGYDMIKVAAKMKRCYLAICNGKVNIHDGLEEVRASIDYLKSQIKIIADLKIWVPKVYARIGDILIKIQDMADQKLAEM